MHEQLKAQSFMANSPIPYSKHGSKQDIETIFNELKIPVESKADDAGLIVTRTNEASVTIAPRVIRENLVPNDGIFKRCYFLLENQGL